MIWFSINSVGDQEPKECRTKRLVRIVSSVVLKINEVQKIELVCQRLYGRLFLVDGVFGV